MSQFQSFSAIFCKQKMKNNNVADLCCRGACNVIEMRPKTSMAANREQKKKIVRYVMVIVLAPSSAPFVDILKISECVSVGGCFIFWTFTKYELVLYYL